jgi:hypothetical protein
MVLDSNVWGPHYWFVLLSIAICYPIHPNDVTKKKYYELIQNLPSNQGQEHQLFQAGLELA